MPSVHATAVASEATLSVSSNGTSTEGIVSTQRKTVRDQNISSSLSAERFRKGARVAFMVRRAQHGDWIPNRYCCRHVEHDFHLVERDRGVRRVDDSCVDLAPRDIIEHLSHVEGEHASTLDLLPQMCAIERCLCVASGGNRPRASDGNATETRKRELVELGRRRRPCRNDQHQSVACEVEASARQ